MKKVFHSAVFTMLFLLFSMSQIYAREPLSFSVQPMLSIPFGPREDAETPYYSAGGGAELTMRYTMPFTDFMFADLNISTEFLPIYNSAFSFSLTSLGLGLGYQHQLGVYGLSVSGIGGYWQGVLLDGGEGGSDGSFFAGIKAGADYQLNDFWNLGLGGSYRYHFYASGGIYHGLGISLTARLNPRSKNPEPRIELDKIQLDPVFPVFYSYYDENSLGKLSFTNNEKGEIRDVTINYYVDQFMERPKTCAHIESLAEGESLEMPLYALFIDSMLGVTEGTKVSSEITVEYDYYGTEKSLTESESLRVHNRNAMTWDDDRKAASFITAKDPEILRFARNVVGEVSRGGAYLGSRDFRLGLAMAEAVGMYGVSYIIDPTTPFKETSASVQSIDYLQFPVQTLIYKAGDCDDLSILYCALLEALGIRTAFITIPGHIYAAFSLGMTPEEAGRYFYGNQDLIYIDEQTWVPVEITLMDKGFQTAWRKGAQEWKQFEPTGEARLYPVADAWDVYSPVGINSGVMSISYDFLDDFFEEYSAAAENTVSRIINETERMLTDKLSEKPSDYRTRNRLAVLYAKFGIYDRAEAEFKRVLSQVEVLSARVNLANLYFLLEDWDEAERNFLIAQQKQPGRQAVELGLAKVRYEQGEYTKAEEGYRTLVASNPELAEKYSYLVLSSDGTSRASGSAGGMDLMWEEELEE